MAFVPPSHRDSLSRSASGHRRGVNSVPRPRSDAGVVPTANTDPSGCSQGRGPLRPLRGHWHYTTQALQ
jgi:hypothetical protein